MRNLKLYDAFQKVVFVVLIDSILFVLCVQHALFHLNQTLTITNSYTIESFSLDCVNGLVTAIEDKSFGFVEFAVDIIGVFLSVLGCKHAGVFDWDVFAIKSPSNEPSHSL